MKVKNNDEISSKLLSYDWCFIIGTAEDTIQKVQLTTTTQS
jgi:hypothetical protein